MMVSFNKITCLLIYFYVHSKKSGYSEALYLFKRKVYWPVLELRKNNNVPHEYFHEPLI
jgi:hypothetical protein